MWICPKCSREFKRADQSHYCGRPPATVEEYIKSQALQARPHLSEIKNAVLLAVPNAKEYIAWGMPVFKRNGNIISFAACREHVSLYVGEQALAAFKEKTGDYNTNKSALYLPYGKPLPLKLIKDLAKWCLA